MTRLTRRTLLTAGLFGLLGGFRLRGAAAVPARRRLDRIPARPAGGPTGSEFAADTAALGGRARQERAVEEILSGNVPAFLRELVPVALPSPMSPMSPTSPASPGGPGGESLPASEPAVWIWVLPDYLAIGEDHDFLRIPLTLPRALEVARAWDMSLPTRKIVDAVYRQAAVRLAPSPMTPGPRMRSSEYYLSHHRLIEEARVGRPLGALTAGHKKDVVLTKRLLRQPDRIAIYGWHRAEAKPIQPLSLVHGARYADYSHGLRLIDSLALYGGKERRLDALLTDPATAGILSFEGELPRQLVRQ